MSSILAIDPGATSGWCLYDSDVRRVGAAGEFPNWQIPSTLLDCVQPNDLVVVEGMAEVHAGIYPETVKAARILGRIEERFERVCGCTVREITRHEVKRVLFAAVHGSINVRKDRDVWAALLLLHGGEASGAKARVKKGVQVAPPGALGLATGHARAAAAVAVAWLLTEAQP